MAGGACVRCALIWALHIRRRPRAASAGAAGLRRERKSQFPPMAHAFACWFWTPRVWAAVWRRWVAFRCWYAASVPPHRRAAQRQLVCHRRVPPTARGARACSGFWLRTLTPPQPHPPGPRVGNAFSGVPGVRGVVVGGSLRVRLALFLAGPDDVSFQMSGGKLWEGRGLPAACRSGERGAVGGARCRGN